MKVFSVRRLLALLLVCAVSALLPLTVIAQVATPSELYQSYYDKVASPSAAIRDQMQSDALIGSDRLNVQLLSDSDDGTIRVVGWLKNATTGQTQSVSQYITNGDTFSLGVNPAGTYWFQLSFYLYKDRGSLPSPGTYSTHGTLTEQVNDYFGYLKSASIRIASSGINVATTAVTKGVDYANYNQYVDCAAPLSIGYKTTEVEYQFNFDVAATKDMTIGLDGKFDYRFNYTDESPAVTAPDISGGGGTAADATADNTAQIVEKQDGILSQIISTTQTIVNQLSAFWDQLAAQFTNLYNKMTQQHTEQLAADQQNTQDIMANQDQNTDTVVNGYDSSGLDANNDKFSSSVEEYGQAEDQIFDSVKDNLSGFEIPEFTSVPAVLAALAFFGGLFQQIFDGLGVFNAPITVSLVLIFVTILIGYYRLRG